MRRRAAAVVRRLRRARGSGAFFTRDALAELAARPDVEIGAWTYGRPTVYGVGENPLVIGRYCSIALDVTIFLGYEHNTRWVSTYPFSDAYLASHFPEAASIVGHPRSKGPVRIGNDVWIGHGAIILSGVTIADGAVIGAGAVVSSDVPPYAIVAGNPAKVVRRRFDDATVERLLALAWWNWPDAVVRRHVAQLCSPDVETLLALSETGQTN